MGATGSSSNPCAEASAERTGSRTNPWHPVTHFLYLETVRGPGHDGGCAAAAAAAAAATVAGSGRVDRQRTCPIQGFERVRLVPGGRVAGDGGAFALALAPAPGEAVLEPLPGRGPAIRRRLGGRAPVVAGCRGRGAEGGRISRDGGPPLAGRRGGAGPLGPGRGGSCPGRRINARAPMRTAAVQVARIGRPPSLDTSTTPATTW